jgi:H+-transporting ATPase
MLASVLAGSASLSVAEILAKLGNDQAIGLNSAQLQERLGKFGPNALPEEKKSALAALLTYSWGPIPWMIEAAALMAAIVRDWALVLVVILVARPWRIIGFVWAYNVAWMISQDVVKRAIYGILDPARL